MTTENTPRIPLDGHAYYAEMPWTWRDRLRFKLFPTQHCPLPEASAEWRDCLIIQTFAYLSLVDRLRVLMTGTLKIETRTVTENIVGGAMTSSVAYPIWRKE